MSAEVIKRSTKNSPRLRVERQDWSLDPHALRSKSRFFNTENRVEITNRPVVRKYAILSALRNAVFRKKIYALRKSCVLLPFAPLETAKNPPVSAKNPRHLGKIPRHPNVLGLRGIFTGCLAVSAHPFSRAKIPCPFLYFENLDCQEKVTPLTVCTLLNAHSVKCFYKQYCKS